MFDESSALSIIDDTKPLTAIITDTENNGSYIVSIKFCIYICYTCTQAFTVILILQGLLEDSSSFNGDPPHSTLNHGFLIIRN